MKLTQSAMQVIHVGLGIAAAVVAIVRYAMKDGHMDPTFAAFAAGLLSLSVANDFFNSPPTNPS